eukprot:COSAG06_NODE_67573_length_251_cov_1.026316_1_plen_38_part_01
MAHTWSVNNCVEQVEVAGMDDAELAFVSILSQNASQVC